MHDSLKYWNETLEQVSTGSRELDKCSKQACIQYDNISLEYLTRIEIEIQYTVIFLNDE